MLSIGHAKRSSGAGLVALLLECHERIRRFLGLAELLAGARSPTNNDVRSSAEQVRRYFTEALPLHVADEEQSIAPRLVQARPELGEALGRMHQEHDSHTGHVDALIELCAGLAEDPERLPDLQGRLGQLTQALARDLLGHLEYEEQVIFPALAELTAEQQDAIVAEMRARRSGTV